MENLSPPPNASPEEIEAWNQMMDTMVTFIKASTNLMNTITTKVKYYGQTGISQETKKPKGIGGCEPECQVCLPKPPPPPPPKSAPCKICPADKAAAATKSPSSKTGVAKDAPPPERTSVIKSSSALKSGTSSGAPVEKDPVVEPESTEGDARPEGDGTVEEAPPPQENAPEEEPDIAEAAPVDEAAIEEAPVQETPVQQEATEENTIVQPVVSGGEIEDTDETGGGENKVETKIDENDQPELPADKEPAAGDISQCCCESIRAEKEAAGKKTRCKCKKKKKKQNMSTEAVIEEEEEEEDAEEPGEVERKCGCGATPGNKDWIMQEMVVKLENAQSEITQLQEELARLQRMDISKRGPHATPNTAKLYQEIMRRTPPPALSPQRQYPQMMQQSPYLGMNTGFSESGYCSRTNQPYNRLPNQSASRLPNQSASRLPNQSASRLPNQSTIPSANNQSANQLLGNSPGKSVDCDPGCEGLSSKESEASLDCNPGCDGQTARRGVTAYESSMGQPQMQMANSYQGVGGQNAGCRSKCATDYYSGAQPPIRRNSWRGSQSQMNPSGYNRSVPNFSQGQQQQNLQQGYRGAAVPQAYSTPLGQPNYYNPSGQYGMPGTPSVIRESVLCPSRAPCQDPPPKRLVVCSQQQPQSQNSSNYDDCSPDCPGSF